MLSARQYSSTEYATASGCHQPACPSGRRAGWGRPSLTEAWRCERSYDPRLRGRPATVLSNNKDCAASTVIPLRKNVQPRMMLRVFPYTWRILRNWLRAW